jgi:serine/threonine protein kinase
MIFGQLPFRGKNRKEIQEKIETCNFKFPEKVCVSEECIQLIKKLLVKSPSNRLKVSDILVDDWLQEEEEFYD